MNKNKMVLLQSLKGRVSKVLTIGSDLTKREKSDLLTMYYIIDEFFTSRHTLKETLRELTKIRSILRDTKRVYVQHHILPLLNKVSNGEWESSNG